MDRIGSEWNGRDGSGFVCFNLGREHERRDRY
jgi:hypothetical protein